MQNNNIFNGKKTKASSLCIYLQRVRTPEKFRENFVMNNKEYIILHPPLISRQMQIEESYKINKLKEVSISKLNKIYSDIDSEYTIKRNKSYQNNNISLEETMGFIKK